MPKVFISMIILTLKIFTDYEIYLVFSCWRRQTQCRQWKAYIFIYFISVFCSWQIVILRTQKQKSLKYVFIQKMPSFKTAYFGYDIKFCIINNLNKKHIYRKTINKNIFCFEEPNKF